MSFCPLALEVDVAASEWLTIGGNSPEGRHPYPIVRLAHLTLSEAIQLGHRRIALVLDPSVEALRVVYDDTVERDKLPYRLALSLLSCFELLEKAGSSRELFECHFEQADDGKYRLVISLHEKLFSLPEEHVHKELEAMMERVSAVYCLLERS